jgi:GT2 family glycosyltransferase/glycosyltransferase involved in cell wall biosynthesis
MKRLAKLAYLVIAPAILLLLAVSFWCADLLAYLERRFGRMPVPQPPHPAEPPRHASIVIPNWNGKDLLERFLPTVLAACSSGDEVIVVDNASSSSDGSAEFVERSFPQVRLLRVERNLGFGGGSNAGIRAATHRIAVLLNNDMRATPDFLAPLLAGFTDDAVFAVSAQLFFSDPERRREETGLTAGSFEKGFIRVRHVADSQIDRLYPIFYAGGGSTAYDREKFLALGGFDLLFEPFYLEDTDLSFNAWRRGWKVLYQPASRLYHEHRATIGKRYSPESILAYLQKNYVLMVWKNVHRWRWLLSHLVYSYGHMILCWAGEATETRTTIGAFRLALEKWPQALRARFQSRRAAVIRDTEVFVRTRPSVFREVFSSAAPLASVSPVPTPDLPEYGRGSVPAPGELESRPLRILFVAPYSIYPPLHGGAVLMLQAIQELSKRHTVFLLLFVDRPEEAESNQALAQWARHVHAVLRRPPLRSHFSLRPHAEQAFFDPQFAALLDKLVFQHEIDIIQFEYTQLAQYRLPLERTPQCLFEHDVYFRSVRRQLVSGAGGVGAKASELFEWLRALRFEVAAAGRFDAVFTCHEEERRLLESFLNGRRPVVLAGLRTAIDSASYPFPGGPRRQDSLLFVGNFQHRPNVEGLRYFTGEILPRIRARRPTATLTVVGAQAPPELERAAIASAEKGAVCFRGSVPDIREPLSEYAVFVCPILSGAGVRVKLLEAFSAGIPVVSTSLGAEGIAAQSGREFLCADLPDAFADACLHLLEHPADAADLAARARRLVETTYDWMPVGRRLDSIYYQLIRQKARP